MSVMQFNFAKLKATCLQCRARKVSIAVRNTEETNSDSPQVRCDGGPGSCHNCERLKYDCSFLQRSDGSSNAVNLSREVQVQLDRRRGVAACAECRSQKTRCGGEHPNCGNCIKRDRQCIYPAPKRPSSFRRKSSLLGTSQQEGHTPAVGPTQAHVATTNLGLEVANRSIDNPGFAQDCSVPDNDMPSIDEILLIVEAYFQHVYQFPWYTFLRKASVIEKVLDDTIEESLTLAICAVTAQRLSFERYPTERRAKWAQRAETLLLEHLEKPSTTRLQALVLITRYRVEAGHFSRAFMLAALASRSAMALRLNYERPDLRFLAREVRRRLMWSCFALDSSFSVGLRDFETCPAETIFLQLPCPEEAFENDIPTKTAPLRATSTREPECLGSYAASLRLVSIRGEIRRLKRNMATATIEPSDLILFVQKLEDELQHLYFSLAEPDRYSSTLFSDTRNQAGLLLLHLSWRQSYCDLYRLFLTGYQEAAPSSVLQGIDTNVCSQKRSLCLQYALSIIQILKEFSEQYTAQVIDFDAAVCTYHSVRIILFIAQTQMVPQSPSREFALEKARYCTRILHRLFPNSLIVEPMQNDLEILMNRYTAEHNMGSSLQIPLLEDETQDEKSRLADEAKSRQRLAIHSLVRRADFEDDSNRVANNLSTSDLQPASNPPERSRIYNESTIPGTSINPAQSLPATKLAQSNLANKNAGNTLVDGGERDEQGQSLDGMRFTFNPWMGWSEELEFYNVFQGLNDDCF